MTRLRALARALAKPARVAWSTAVWIAQLVANKEPVRVTGLLGGLGLALAARFGIDATVAQSVVPGVVTWLLAELARAKVTPAAGLITVPMDEVDPEVVKLIDDLEQRLHLTPTPAVQVTPGP